MEANQFSNHISDRKFQSNQTKGLTSHRSIPILMYLFLIVLKTLKHLSIKDDIDNKCKINEMFLESSANLLTLG